MKAKYLFLIMIWLFTWKIQASDEAYAELFVKGNQAYERGAYDSALSFYSDIVKNGVSSTELYYNLGNAYHKTGDNLSAILYFEKALKTNPDDKDIIHNLEVLNNTVTDKITPIDQVFFKQWWLALARSMGVDKWAWFFIISLSICCASLTIFFVSRYQSARQLGFIGAVILFIISAFVLAAAFESKSEFDRKFAIVFRPTLQVKSEPSQRSSVQFVIHEGLKVEVKNEQEEWAEIELSDGMSGWVPSLSIQKI